MAVCNNGLILISNLPEINGFSWWQFLEIWPRQHTLINDDYQYNSELYTNVKIYISSLNIGVREKIQEIYNNSVKKINKLLIIFEEDTIYHCVQIIKMKSTQIVF
tara:strand:- start:74 stop:388 length:315 start_codon:yes stop_codon:yes gene_type:complete